MTALNAILLAATLATVPPEAKFIQIAPWSREVERFERSPGQEREVVLIRGLDVQVFKDAEVAKARFRSWQQPGSVLVEALARDADVFAFANGQTVAVDEVANSPELAEGVRQLRALGYAEIVLLGHSAGGLVARLFVEDHPDAGVTKIIQVGTPNGGSSWSRLKDGVRSSQEAFVTSLSKQARADVSKKRQGKQVPAGVQFVCVVCNGLLIGDGVVSCACQWPEDLQQQGVPVVALRTDHFRAVRDKDHARTLAELVRTDQPRWSIAEVEAARAKLFGSPIKLK